MAKERITKEMLADRLSYGFFNDELALSPEDLLPYLRRKDDSSSAERAVAKIYSKIASNISCFDVEKDSWGTITRDYYCMTLPKFDELAIELGFNKQVIKDFLIDNNLTKTTKNQKSYTTYMNGAQVRTIAFKIDPPFLRENSEKTESA